MTYIYQAVIILNPTNETIVKAEIKKFTDILQGFSSRKKVKVEDMGEKRLAYEIKSHKSGWYCMFTFQAHPEDIAEIERQLRIDDHVLKFMTVKHSDEDEDDDTILEDYHPESEQDHPDAATTSAVEVDMFDLIFGSDQRDRCSL